MEINYQTGKDRKKRTKGAPELSTLVYGKVPPQARDLEEAILGAVLLEKGAFDEAIEFIKPECFYVDSHQRIFSAIMGLQQKSMPIDILTVVEELRKRDELDIVGGAYFVTKLTNSVVSSAHLGTHCKIILQKFIQRELIRISGEIIGDAYEDSTDAYDLLDFAEKCLFDLTTGNQQNNFYSTEDLAAPTLAQIEYLMNNRHELTGVPTGYRNLDAVTGGWQPTDLIILAARPSVGKTAFALNLARNAAMHPWKAVPVGIFSLEMSKGQLMNRLTSAISKVGLDLVSRGKLDEYQFKLVMEAIVKISQTKIFIDDHAGLNIFELRAKVRRLVSKHKVGLVIIDYLQLMSGVDDKRGGNREQEISTISRGLKGLAKELNIPIIALSQLNRDVEKRKDGIPMLSDLRESGAIEQDADVVGFLYRPDYQQESDKVDPAFKNDAFVKIAKNRNGDLITLSFHTDLRIQTWFDSEGWSEYNNLPAGNWKRIDPPAVSPGIDYTEPANKHDEELDYDDKPFD